MISHYSRKFSKLLPCTEVLYLQMLPTVKNTFFKKILIFTTINCDIND